MRSSFRTIARKLAGALRAHVAGGEVTLPFQEGWSAGDRATLALRPECVAIAGPDDRADLLGIVATLSYVGGSVEYGVRVGDGTVRVRAPAGADLTAGARVGLRIVGPVSAWRS